MTLDEYLERGWSLITEGVDDHLVEMLEQATEDFPESPELWCLRGDALQLYDGSRQFRARDFEICYRQAIDCEPEHAEAWESLGYVQDVYFEEFCAAEQSFQRAIELGAGEDAYLGLARVLAQLNRGYDALNLLALKRCPFATTDNVKELRNEILHGQWETR